MELFSYNLNGCKIFFFLRLSSDPTKSVEVKLDANWNRTDWNHFNYDTDMSPSSMARDIARELWSREYFQTLNK